MYTTKKSTQSDDGEDRVCEEAVEHNDEYYGEADPELRYLRMTRTGDIESLDHNLYFFANI